ncbi:MAG: copper amine oxidase N-terminal domain-containing protein [Defluviitaleaceae bacterium]|nr:copper amine oxidase N-terminal domain-containing protein [Defluviitaleaceae bacterium]MCL2835576.1 copper amine oxidase N-terminal domain-containing protein [Defluviitaleaceae bacterium]
MKLMARIPRCMLAAVIAATALISAPAAVWGGNVTDAIRAGLGDKMPAFTAFTGTIIEISDYHGDPGRKFVSVEDEDEGVVNFILTENTLFFTAPALLYEGNAVTGYYDNLRPMMMIYPPQPEAFAFSAVMQEPPFVKLDRFDGELVSFDGMLKLNITADTIIHNQDGDDFEHAGQTLEEALAGAALKVIYSVSTRSIPALTTPDFIMVLYETAEIPVIPVYPAAGTPVPLVVQNELAGEVPFEALDDGTVMVPLRVVSDALGIELGWDGETQSVIWDGLIKLSIGADEYICERRGEAVSINIGAAPTLINDRTYVPLQFFTEVAGFNNAYFFEGQIEINDFDLMQ